MSSDVDVLILASGNMNAVENAAADAALKLVWNSAKA